MRQPTSALAAAVICVLTVGCTSTVSNAESPTTTQPRIPRPLVERELAGLLLNPDQVNVAMGTAGMAVTHQQTSMSDNSATMAPPECLAINGAAEGPVYADSGYWAERDQSLNNGDKFTHYLKQAVVLFPTIEKAGESPGSDSRGFDRAMMVGGKLWRQVESHEGRCDMEADDYGTDKPLIDPGYDYEYDEAHEVPVGTLRQTPAPRRVDAPTEVHLSEGGDYGYDEAHDFCARRSTEK